MTTDWTRANRVGSEEDIEMNWLYIEEGRWKHRKCGFGRSGTARNVEERRFHTKLEENTTYGSVELSKEHDMTWEMQKDSGKLDKMEGADEVYTEKRTLSRIVCQSKSCQM